jgi:hypothetical protein
MAAATTRNASSSSSVSIWRQLSLALSVLVLVQWLVVTYWLMAVHPHDNQQQQQQQQQELPDYDRARRIEDQSFVNSNSTGTSSTPRHDFYPLYDDEYDGVAVTLMLKAPKWFHRRYTVMVHNVLANIPAQPYQYAIHHPPHSATNKAVEPRRTRGGGDKGHVVVVTRVVGPFKSLEIYPGWNKRSFHSIPPCSKCSQQLQQQPQAILVQQQPFKRDMGVMTFSLPNCQPP